MIKNDAAERMLEFLERHAGGRPVSFHMPGHKGSDIFRRCGYDRFLTRFMDMDVTEIPGADNLFSAEGIIAEIQERYAGLYGAKKSWLMVNGTSGGLIAAILATVPRGGKLIMARNCHKAVFNGLRLAGGVPVYARPTIIEEYGISGEITPEEIKRLVAADPDAHAIIVTSPNYYGICSDIRAIADIAHEAGMILIVDQAHGAHLKFFSCSGLTAQRSPDKFCSEDSLHVPGISMPLSAEEQGADIVTNSTHKTLASMTQSAILNLCSDRVDPADIEEQLQIIESSSPSYILMTSLDINARILEEHGDRLFDDWQSGLEYFYREAQNIPGLKVMGANDELKFALDMTKLNLDFGMPGLELENRLNARGIFPELATGNILMCMTGIGNTKDHFEALLSALNDIGNEIGKKEIAKEQYAFQEGCSHLAMERKVSPVRQPAPGRLHSVPEKKEKIKITEAAGRICAVSIIPYPPGTPLVCPGEEITQEIADYVVRLREQGEKVMGIDSNHTITVGAD